MLISVHMATFAAQQVKDAFGVLNLPAQVSFSNEQDGEVDCDIVLEEQEELEPMEVAALVLKAVKFIL